MLGTIFIMSPRVTHLNMGRKRLNESNRGNSNEGQLKKDHYSCRRSVQTLQARLFRNQFRGNSGKAPDASVFSSCKVLLFHFNILHWYELVALF